MTKRRRAGVYVRISNDPEGEALGVQRQEKDCRKLVNRHRWDLVEPVYSDNDTTASGRKRRPGWERLLQDLSDGTVDAVVAYSSSRLYRRPADLARLIELANTRDIEIATVASGNLDLSTADGRMTANILVSVDQGELERVQERVSRAMLAKASKGERWGGRRPFGYRVTGTPKSSGGNGQKVVKEPKEARAIRRGADLVLGGATASAVARDWNDRGVLTPGGRRWSVTRVKAVLSSGLIAGLRAHKSGTYPGTWDPIVTEDEHQALKALLAPKKSNGNGQPRARRHPLTGVMVCGSCGHPMSGRTQPDGRRSYACPSGQGGCGRVAIGASAAEDVVLDAVQDRDPAYVKKRRLTTPQRVDREAAVALTEVARKRTVLQQAAELGVDVTKPMRALDEQERELQARVRVEPRADDPEKDDPKRRDRRHRGELTEAEVEQTAAWVREWVDRVDVRKAQSTREPAADRLSIVWR
jgi:site-specific DNA recombinase